MVLSRLLLSACSKVEIEPPEVTLRKETNAGNFSFFPYSSTYSGASEKWGRGGWAERSEALHAVGSTGGLMYYYRERCLANEKLTHRVLALQKRSVRVMSLFTPLAKFSGELVMGSLHKSYRIED